MLRFTYERDIFFLRVNDCKLPKEDLIRKLSEQEVILKSMMASVKPLENNLRSIENEKKLPEKADEKLLRKYGEKHTLMGSSVKRWQKALLLVLQGCRCVSARPFRSSD